VKFEGDKFLEKAKSLVAELENYKRRPGYERDIEYGDLTYYPVDKIASRSNVNDQGDIYFVNSKYANYCKCEAEEYLETTIRESRGYIKVEIKDSISEHHYYDRVKRIVEKYFEIA
jgi:hypothetical protein